MQDQEGKDLEERPFQGLKTIVFKELQTVGPQSQSQWASINDFHKGGQPLESAISYLQGLTLPSPRGPIQRILTELSWMISN